MLLLRSVSIVGAACLVLWSCAQEPAASAASVPASSAGEPSDGDQILAQMDGRKITRAEVDERIAGGLAKLRQEEYELRRDAIDEMVADELIDREAAARGISSDELFKREVEDKVPPPKQAEIDAFYEQNKSRMGGQSKLMVQPQIVRVIQQSAYAKRARELRRELAEKANLMVNLAPPRVSVAIPASAPALGPKDAPITIVEFTDYQCPFCIRAQDTVDEVLERYAGKVRLVYRDLPLDMHSRAFAASRAARCAGEQDKFWEYHRSLLRTAGDFSDEDLRQRAGKLSLDARMFSACLASERQDAAIRDSLADAGRLGVTATPTFFINGRLISGARPFEDFEDIIEEELSAHGS